MKELPIHHEQARLLTEIGDYLRQLRERQELSLDEVASKTLIPVRLLTAIEAGDMDRLPEPVYIQGFIKRYGDAIGVDGTEFANAFPTGISRRPAKSSWRGTIEAQLRPVHLYVLYMLLVVGAVSSLSFLLNRSVGQNFRYATTASPIAGQPNLQPGDFYGPPAPNQSAAPSASKVFKSSIPSPLSAKPVRVSLTVKGQQSWLRTVVDGKTAFEGMLQQGAQRTWAAEEEVTIRAGDAGAVEVSYNESQPKPLGEPGDVQEKTFGKPSQAIAPAPPAITISQAF